MKNFKIKSFCKINLTLNVLKKLDNGYHAIASLVTFCDLHDDISIRKINELRDKITFSGKFKKGINKKSNTITKLLYLLRRRNFFNKQNFKINIKKNIPHGSGLGGGSSNAASLLNFFNIKMDLGLSKKRTYEIARQIGFDTPINLIKKNTFIDGKKNRLIRFNNKIGLNLLIIYPNIICSTKKMYKKNKIFSYKKNKIKFKIKKNEKLINYLINENNDLQEVVIKYYPKIKKIINYIKSQNGCSSARITGSGSACFGIFSSKKNAINAHKMIKTKYPKYWSATSKTI